MKELAVPDGYTNKLEATVDGINYSDQYEDLVGGSGKGCCGYVITNTHVPVKTKITAVKVWEDENDFDHIRPEYLTVKLIQVSGEDETELESAALSAANGWQYTWNDLPTIVKGKEVSYKVKEIIPEELKEYYTAEKEELPVENDGTATFTNTHEVEKVSAKVEKEWKDGDDHDKIRPKTLTFKLLADDKEVEGQTVTVPVAEDGSCTYEWKDLPKYSKGADGKLTEIEYSAFEVVPEGYIASAETADGTTTITNTHAIATTAVWVLKTWDDANDQDGKRKEAKFTLKAFAGGEEITPQMYDAEADEIKDVEEVTWSTLKNEYHIWSKLLKTLDGEEISYQVDEEEIEDYTTTMESSSPTGFRYKNTHIPETVEISVTKVWEDGDNCCKKRPYTVSAQLYADGEPVGIPLVLSQINNWTRTWKNLPKYKVVEKKTTDDEGKEVTTKTGGQEIVYTVKEVEKPDGYLEPVISGSVEDGFVITNTIDTVEISGKKTWDDGFNVDKLRPEKITIRLFADGKVVKGSDKVVTADTYWMYKWTDLPKYNIKADGTKTEIVYTVVEDPVAGYVAKYKKGTYDITNKHTPKKPCTPGTPTTPGSGYRTPVKTGDETPIAPYMLLFLAAAAIILEEMIRRRRKAAQSEE